ncbi:MAG TPA: DUF3617 domain-containing protein [Rhizomicrobium sp.]|jgi:hypothetical protein|nr:DUF3617 domain-containing protein [Rhizomicrobium sp.]
MSFRPAAFLAFAVLLTPAAALAAHGKAGLWSSTATVSLPGMPAQTHASTYCMTAAQVVADVPPADKNSGCSYKNVSVQGHTFTAEMVCTGQFEATGRFTSTYDSDTHYTATIAMTTSGMSMTNRIEGKWLKADCAGADH